MPETIKPLTSAEKLLLEAFVDVSNDKPNSLKIFNATCDMLDALTRVVKAKTKLDKLKK